MSEELRRLRRKQSTVDLQTPLLAHTVESLNEEIGRIVAERQALRESGADASALEANRRQLAAAQARLSLLLIRRHLPGAEFA